MMNPDDWKIPADAENWECDWESSRRFQMRYFRALPMADKIRAIEEMERIARLLQEQRRMREA